MRVKAFRTLGTIAVTAAMTLGGSAFVGVPAAHALDPVPAVGGGAAGLRLVGGDEFFPDGASINIDDEIATPSVTLPPEGSGNQVLTDQLVDEMVAGVTATVAKVTTTGNLTGHPYARSSSTLTDVHMGTTTVAYVHTQCDWSESGTTASTTIIGLGADQTPAPNTHHDIPGVGTVWLNHQFPNEVYDRHVITVVAIDIELDSIPGGVITSDRPFHLQIGFSSCDPSDPPSREQTLQAQLVNFVNHVGIALPGG